MPSGGPATDGGLPQVDDRDPSPLGACGGGGGSLGVEGGYSAARMHLIAHSIKHSNSKRAPRAPKSAPRAPQEGSKRRFHRLLRGGALIKYPPFFDRCPPRWPQEAPRRPQEAPKMAPRGPQEAPRGLQEAPKRPQDGPKRPPRGPQEAPQRPPGCSQEAPKIPRGLKKIPEAPKSAGLDALGLVQGQAPQARGEGGRRAGGAEVRSIMRPIVRSIRRSMVRSILGSIVGQWDRY